MSRPIQDKNLTEEELLIGKRLCFLCKNYYRYDYLGERPLFDVCELCLMNIEKQRKDAFLKHQSEQKWRDEFMPRPIADKELPENQLKSSRIHVSTVLPTIIEFLTKNKDQMWLRKEITLALTTDNKKMYSSAVSKAVKLGVSNGQIKAKGSYVWVE